MFDETSVQVIEKAIGYVFRDKSWLEKAFTHSSCANEKRGKSSYERLEFLGDSLLDFIVSDILCRDCPQKNEGELSKMRAQIVSKAPLAECVENAGIEKFLIAGEMGYQKVMSDKVRSDLFEAICAAIYRDSGIKYAAAFVVKMLRPVILKAEKGRFCDYKSALYEKAKQENVKLEISVSDIGDIKDPKFRAAITFGDFCEEGEGASKIDAQQAAAAKIYQKFDR